jgi:hypothetical protein
MKNLCEDLKESVKENMTAIFAVLLYKEFCTLAVTE